MAVQDRRRHCLIVYRPRPNVSPDGRRVIFTSNWEKTLGIDPGTNTFRQDVFLLALP
jgi:hypothetical protein